MSLKMKKVVVSWFFSLFLVFAAITGAQAYSSILAFGDSLSDNGYYQLYSGGTTGNTNPYDVYGFSRYSDGPVWVEYMATKLGVSLMDMAYGGATSGVTNPYAAMVTGNSAYDNATGLLWQVNQAGTIASDTLITLTAGGNDYFNYVQGLLGTPFTTQAGDDYAAGLYNADAAAANIALAINALIGKGGRTFVLQELALDNAWADAFNYCLNIYLSAISAQNSDVDIHILDITTIDVSDLDTVTIDGIHPTTVVHERIANMALAATVPEPASILLLIVGFAGLVGVRRRMK